MSHTPSRIAAGPSPRISGRCTPLFATDIGFAIDLDLAQTLLREGAQREVLRHRRRSPQSFQYSPAPVRVTLPAPSVEVGRWRTQPGAECILWDFGAVSISFAIEFDETLDELCELGAALYEHAGLLEAVRALASELARLIASAITRPGQTELFEDYAIFAMRAPPSERHQHDPVEPGGHNPVEPGGHDPVEPGGPAQAHAPPDGGALGAPVDAQQWLAQHAGTLARVLRAERGALSPGEAADALGGVLSYTPHDAAVIDWNAAFLIGDDLDDLESVLEFANVELVEMRHLDSRLDRSLDEAFRQVSAPGWWGGLPLLGATPRLRRLAALQIDGAALFESVNNALKLLGDQYLARVYRLAAQRFHLAEWDAAILRKLNTLESLHDKFAGQTAARRLEALEWIVILLIAIEVGFGIFDRL